MELSRGKIHIHTTLTKFLLQFLPGQIKRELQLKKKKVFINSKILQKEKACSKTCTQNRLIFSMFQMLTFLTNIWLPLEPNLSLIPLPIGPGTNPRSISMFLSGPPPIAGPNRSKPELIRSMPIPIPPAILFIPPIPPPTEEEKGE